MGGVMRCASYKEIVSGDVQATYLRSCQLIASQKEGLNFFPGLDQVITPALFVLTVMYFDLVYHQFQAQK